MRVYSGALDTGHHHPSTQDQKIKKGFLVFTRCTPTSKMPSLEVGAGDIATGKVSRISIWVIPGAEGHPIIPGINGFPKPVIGIAVEPKESKPPR